MVPWRRLRKYVKGYEFSDEKMGSVFGFDGLTESETADDHVMAAVKTVLDDEAYKALTVARRVDESTSDTGQLPKTRFVLVLDDDNDLEKLKKRPLPEHLHWTIERIMVILDGPHVYKPVA